MRLGDASAESEQAQHEMRDLKSRRRNEKFSEACAESETDSDRMLVSFKSQVNRLLVKFNLVDNGSQRDFVML